MTTTSGRVILFGATGYTGALALAELREYGLPITLVGRDPQRLHDLADQHGGDIEVEHGDATSAATLPKFAPDDVIISTAGPFTRIGFAVADAAIKAGAAYLDSTGEPPFIKSLFQSRSVAARQSGATVIPAFGYDYAPGAVAAADALTRAPHATGVRIGYFLTDHGGNQIPLRQLQDATTPGTRESLAGVIAEKSFAYRSQAPNGLLAERAGQHLLRFSDLRGKRVRAISVGGAEHFSVPEAFPHIDTVDVGLGWLAAAATPLHIATRLLGPAVTSRPAQGLTTVLAAKLPWQDRMPTGTANSTIIAEATDKRGYVAARTILQGTEPYQFTGSLLAWGAHELLNQERPGTAIGVCGPLKGFGINRITTGVANAGIAIARSDQAL